MTSVKSMCEELDNIINRYYGEETMLIWGMRVL